MGRRGSTCAVDPVAVHDNHPRLVAPTGRWARPRDRQLTTILIFNTIVLMPSPRALLLTTAAGLALTLGLTACDDGGSASTAATISEATAATTGEATATATTGEADRITVLTSFYPLEYLVEQIGGDAVTASSLTPQGAEPHDLELSPAQVSQLSRADLLVYLSGFQPSVDAAVDQTDPSSLDVADVVDLEPLAAGDDHDHAGGDNTNGTDAVGNEGSHDHGQLDPHFWQDPERMAAAAEAVADALAAADPAEADTFYANADALITRLDALDSDYRTGLAACDSNVLVTAHEAFGYLTRAYGLEQVGIAGIDPEGEPSPARLREIGDIVQSNGVTTIFAESLINPRVAQVLADDLGIATAVLDPVESITATSPGDNYDQVMRANLSELRKALGCS